MMIYSEFGDQWIDNTARRHQDEAFCRRMMWAFWHGYETPPAIDMDTRPGTKKPRRLPQPKTILPQQWSGE
jgi:hypothetical protein